MSRYLLTCLLNTISHTFRIALLLSETDINTNGYESANPALHTSKGLTEVVVVLALASTTQIEPGIYNTEF